MYLDFRHVGECLFWFAFYLSFNWLTFSYVNWTAKHAGRYSLSKLPAGSIITCHCVAFKLERKDKVTCIFSKSYCFDIHTYVHTYIHIYICTYLHYMCACVYKFWCVYLMRVVEIFWLNFTLNIQERVNLNYTSSWEFYFWT